MRTYRIAVAVVAVLILTVPLQAGPTDIRNYYIGPDGLATIASGPYIDLPNPNHNRLTFLFAHVSDSTPASNHYHRLGAIVYTGPRGSAPDGSDTATTFGNPKTPEGTRPPLVMTPGSGLFDGRQVSHFYDAFAPYNVGTVWEYSDTRITPTSYLTGSGPYSSFPGATQLYNSSGGRYNGSLTGTNIIMELVARTPGLSIGTSSNPDVLINPGDFFELGIDGNFDFTPVFSLPFDQPAIPGGYSATFILRDRNGVYGNSGQFTFNLQPIPEPATCGLLGLAVVLGSVLLLKKKRLQFSLTRN